MRTCLLLKGLVALATLHACPVLVAQASADEERWFPRFKEHLVARLPGGYKVVAVDINQDGRQDIVGLATSPSCLAWYENPSWAQHNLTSQARDFIDLAAYDIDQDGRSDLAIAHEFGMSRTTSGGFVHWLQCPPDPTGEWPLRAVGAEPTSHRIKWADIDGNGRKELINAPVMGHGAKAPLWDVGVRLISYAIPDSPLTKPWNATAIDDKLTVVHGIAVVDWDRDGRDDILTASFEGVHLFRPRGSGSKISWHKTQLALGEQIDPAKRGSSEIAVGTLGDRRRRFLATIEPWHGDKVVVYTSSDAEVLWERSIIDTTFDEGHALICADLDRDGTDEIVAGYRGRGRSLYVYKCRDSSGRGWVRAALDEGDMAASGLDVADINGDGRLDVICVGTASSNIKWYENLGQ